jgi:hypothetical protein
LGCLLAVACGLREKETVSEGRESTEENELTSSEQGTSIGDVWVEE